MVRIYVKLLTGDIVSLDMKHAIAGIDLYQAVDDATQLDVADKWRMQLTRPSPDTPEDHWSISYLRQQLTDVEFDEKENMDEWAMEDIPYSKQFVYLQENDLFLLFVNSAEYRVELQYQGEGMISSEEEDDHYGQKFRAILYENEAVMEDVPFYVESWLLAPTYEFQCDFNHIYFIFPDNEEIIDDKFFVTYSIHTEYASMECDFKLWNLYLPLKPQIISFFATQIHSMWAEQWQDVVENKLYERWMQQYE